MGLFVGQWNEYSGRDYMRCLQGTCRKNALTLKQTVIRACTTNSIQSRKWQNCHFGAISSLGLAH
ncbi:hypothetical protein BZM27_05560 [Paraburkholderia steynii]|uniref:Uncharacterized protein n=1 Tax=Paraburkholderia steynii TaxID=1245441 RepID=A0A4R0XGI5_9BURK|nr:hypothetical protein BZM27_05560 [Paraburkholderia steynii]